MLFKTAEITVVPALAVVALPERSQAWAQQARAKLARSPTVPNRVLGSSSSTKVAAASVAAAMAPVLDPALIRTDCLEGWYLFSLL